METSALLTTKKTVATARMGIRSIGPNGSAPSRGMSVSVTRTSDAAATETEYWAALKAIFLTGLPLIVSATMLAPTRPASATAGPPASISASAKQVEVVTSPSDPRVWTLRGTISPTSAQRAKRPSSGVRSWSSVSTPLPMTTTAHAIPAATTRVTYRSSGWWRRGIGVWG